MSVLFVTDPLPGLSPDIDASVGLMSATEGQGDDVWWCTPEDLAWCGGRLLARARQIALRPRRRNGTHQWLVTSPCSAATSSASRQARASAASRSGVSSGWRMAPRMKSRVAFWRSAESAKAMAFPLRSCGIIRRPSSYVAEGETDDPAVRFPGTRIYPRHSQIRYAAAAPALPASRAGCIYVRRIRRQAASTHLA